MWVDVLYFKKKTLRRIVKKKKKKINQNARITLWDNPANVFARTRLLWSRSWPNIPQLKLGNIRVGKNPACCKKYLKGNGYMQRPQYARILVLGHYLFLEAHSFPGVPLFENRSLLGIRAIASFNIGYCLRNIFKKYLDSNQEYNQSPLLVRL